MTAARPTLGLDGRVAVVTGGASGIGLGMAGALVDAGATVEIWDRDSDALERAMSRAESSRLLARQVDIADEQAVADAVDAAVGDRGRVDAVFANAGTSRPARLSETRREDVESVFGVNVLGTLWTLKHAARHMVDRATAGDRGGSLVVTSSLAAVDASPGNVSYAASKAAVLAIMRSAAVDLAPHAVRVNAILPGWTRSGMTDSSGRAAFYERVIDRRVPMRRWGEPEDFGGIAVYLASTASAFHTGDTFTIDGGYAVF